MISKNDLIIIDSGEMFEGTVDQFKDCFFSNASERVIKEWYEDNGYKFEIIKQGYEEFISNLEKRK